MQPTTTVAPCILHKEHIPAPTYQELHHIIPQAWQAIYSPPTFVHPPPVMPEPDWPYAHISPDKPGLWLWDARTAPLCRTGHGNVHHWLVFIMQELAQNPSPGQPFNIELEVALASLRRIAHGARLTVTPTELNMAVKAITRFMAAGGILKTLWDAEEWGEI